MFPGLTKKSSLPTTLPREITPYVQRLAKASSREECLRKAFEIIVKKNHGGRLQTIFFTHRLFSVDLSSLWKRQGYAHCHHMNYLLRALLVGSGHFKEKDIEQWFCVYGGLSPHQYLRVNIGGKRPRWVFVDPWALALGRPFGTHAGSKGWLSRQAVTETI